MGLGIGRSTGTVNEYQYPQPACTGTRSMPASSGNPAPVAITTASAVNVPQREYNLTPLFELTASLISSLRIVAPRCTIEWPRACTNQRGSMKRWPLIFSPTVIAGDARGACSRNASPDKAVTYSGWPAFSSWRSCHSRCSASAAVRNTAVMGASVTGAPTPLAVRTSKASMQSWLRATLARIARFHNDRPLLAMNWARKTLSPVSAVNGKCRGAVGSRSARSPWRSTPGEFSERVSPGAIHPPLPQEAPAAASVRSTTVTSTPRSCKNHAVDTPTMPEPTTITDRGPPSICTASTTTHLRSWTLAANPDGGGDRRRSEEHTS